jgi:hypothetical protein
MDRMSAAPTNLLWPARSHLARLRAVARARAQRFQSSPFIGALRPQLTMEVSDEEE